ncbi:MAG TPA: hypothetical protein VM757_04565 [Sphingomicrobium sp.]|jgi:hypothetical protein|nr:hypothetical protein [Sphingomicrobium sp.]
MMILVMSFALVSAAAQNAMINSARDGLRSCFKAAATQAKAEKVAKDGFQPYARTHCATQASKFMDAVWAFDAKNKVGKKQSNADAALQIEDFLVVADEKFQMEGGQ